MEQRVMAGVGVIYMARTLVSRTALELYVLLFAGWGLVQLTWVHRVFENWAHVGLSGTYTFVTFALTHTHLATQLTLLAFAAAGAALLWDASRALLRPQVHFA